MRNLLLILGIFFCSISFSTHAQVGFLTKRFTASIGLSHAPLIYAPFRSSREYYVSSTVNGVFNPQPHLDHDYSSLYFIPEVNAEVGITLSKRLHFSLWSSFRSLSPLQLTYTQSSKGSFGGSYETSSDVFSISSRELAFGADFKIYSEYAPIGGYFSLGAGLSRISSTVDATLNYEQYNDTTQVTQSNEISLDTWQSNLNVLQLSFGMGKSRMLSDNTFIEYGGRFSLFFRGKNLDLTYYPLANGDKENYDYQTEFDQIIKHYQTKNVRLANTIELYVKFGFCK